MKKFLALFLALCLVTGCASAPKPYVGVKPGDPRFERGRPVLLLDAFGDLISKIYQLLFWTRGYGNHRISEATEAELVHFMDKYQLTDVKVRINQWAPHKEMGRLIKNKHIAWPYKILFFPSTLIVSLLARPFSGLLISDYYDPGSNTINIFSDDVAIALHEAGHAADFAGEEFKGTYALIRILPGINLFQESIATDEAIHYLEEEKKYEQMIRAYKVLYPAYSTYAVSYLSASPVALIGAITIGHILGRIAARDKKWELEISGKWKPVEIQNASASKA